MPVEIAGAGSVRETVALLHWLDHVKIRVVSIGQPRELLTTLTVSGYVLPAAPASRPEDKPQGPGKD